MSWPVGGMQAFMRAANLFGPDAMDQSYQQPDETVQAPVGPEPENVTAQVGPPGMPPLHPNLMAEQPLSKLGSQLRQPIGQQEPQPDEYLTAQQEQQPDAMEQFRQSVLNPPQRTHMTYPKNTLAGLDAALKIAAEKTPYEQNRVFINGNPYQQVKVVTDAQGNKQYLNKYKQPGFMEQVMRAMPAAASPAVDILNQPYEDQLADWKLKNEGLGKLATAESNMALAGYRGAQAAAVPIKAATAQDVAMVRAMDANTKARLATLQEKMHDLTDSQKAALAQQLQLSKQDLAGIQALERVNAQQAGATERTAMTTTSNERIQNQRGNQAMEQIGARGKIQTELQRMRGEQASSQITQRGQEARTTKAAPSGTANATANLPTQQKVALLERTQQVLDQNPDWEGYINFDDTTGLPDIETPSSWKYGHPNKDTYDKIYEALYGTSKSSPIPPKGSTQITTPQGGAGGRGTQQAQPAQPTPNPLQPPQPPPSQNQTTVNPAAPMVPTKPPQTGDLPSITTPTGQKITVPPPKTPGVQPIIQSNADGSKYRISYDGGKTFQPYNPFGR